jgi:hypothetical protein
VTCTQANVLKVTPIKHALLVLFADAVCERNQRESDKQKWPQFLWKAEFHKDSFENE